MGLTSRYRALIDDPFGRTPSSVRGGASNLTMDSGFHSTDTMPPLFRGCESSVSTTMMTSSQVVLSSPVKSTDHYQGNQTSERQPCGELVFRFDEDQGEEKERQRWGFRASTIGDNELDLSLMNKGPRLDFPAAFVTGFEDGGINFEIPGVAIDRFSPPDGLRVGFKAHKFGEVTGDDVNILASAADALTRFRNAQQVQGTTAGEEKHRDWDSTSSCGFSTPSHSFTERCQYLIGSGGSYNRFG